MSVLPRSTVFVGAIFALTLLSSTAFADSSPKIGVVDVQRALFSIPAGKSAKKKLEKATKAKKADEKQRTTPAAAAPAHAAKE